MFNIHILAIGKLKENYLHEAENEYLKRLRPYARIIVQEIPEEAFRDATQKEKVTLCEAQALDKKLPKNGLLVALDSGGKQMDSVQFAKFLNEHTARGAQITFIIGGPLGLHRSILEKADCRISLSALTFTHQMARVILLEQMYRAATILAGKKYHY